MSESRGIRAVLALLFVSGLCGLVYEVLWLRYLTLLVGSTTAACAVVLSVFMGGLAVGNLVIGHLADKCTNRLRLYGSLELLIALVCVTFPLVWRFASWLYSEGAIMWADAPVAVSALRLALSGLIVFFPTFLMGGTLPVLARHLAGSAAEVRRRVALLYYANSLGAVAGCLLAGFVLIRALGMAMTNTVAAVTNALVGMTALILARRTQPQAAQGLAPLSHTPAPDEPPVGNHSTRPWAAGIALMGIGLSGFAAMTYEVVWTRLFTIVLGTTTYAFTLMLAAFITGIAFGSQLISRRSVRSDSQTLFGLCELGICCSVLMAMPIYPWLPYAFMRISDVVGRTQVGFVLYQFLTFGFSFLIMFVPTTLFGMTLPLVSDLVARRPESVGRRVGTVFAFNTAGALLGALAAGLLLIPWIGLRHTIELGIVINGAVGAVVLFAPGPKRTLRAHLCAAAALTLMMMLYFVFVPDWDRQLMTAGVGRFARRKTPAYADYVRGIDAASCLFYREGREATVSVESALGAKTLLINGKPDASTIADMPTQILLAHVPLLLAPDARRVLIVGVGSGITVGSALTHPVEHVDAVEISAAVIDAAHYFSPENRDFWKDERLELHVTDATTFVNTAPRGYDVIISEPSNPWVAGMSDLFSVEFFQSCREALANDGLMAQWFHGYAMDMRSFRMIVRTFARCFPYVSIWETAEGDFVLIGSAHARDLDFQAMRDRVSVAEVQVDLKRIDIVGLPAVLACQFVSSANVPRVVGSGVVNSQRSPKLEYRAAAVLFRKKHVSVRRIDERFRNQWTDLYINRYRVRYPLSAQDYYHIAKADFANPLSHDLRLAVSAMEQCLSMAPENEEYLIEFARLLRRMGRLCRARELVSRLLRIDPENPAYTESLRELDQAIDAGRRSIFYAPAVPEATPEAPAGEPLKP